MTPSMIDGLMQNVWDENPMSVMEKLLQESKKPIPLREPPFRRAGFLNSTKDPTENPWWILFGYDTDRGSWKGAPSEYSIEGLDGVLPLAERADDLMSRMTEINTGAWQHSNRLRWSGLMAFVAAIQRKCLPGFTVVSWAELSKKEFYGMTQEDPITGLTCVWAMPYMSTQQEFLDVVRDGIAAIWRFMLAAGLATHQMSMPSQQSFTLMAPATPKERNLKTLNTFLQSSNIGAKLESLRGLGGVHDVFKSSSVLESGILEIVSGNNLRGLCAQNSECFVEEFGELVSTKLTWFAQIGGEFFVASYLVWDYSVNDFKLKLEKVDGRRVGDVFDCRVKENITYKVHRNTLSICHGKVGGGSGNWAQYNSQGTEEWFPDRGIVIPRAGSECPHIVMIEWLANSDPKRRMHWVKCSEVPDQVRKVGAMTGRLAKVHGVWAPAGKHPQARLFHQWAKRH